MARFAGFKPEGMRKIASRMGYQGSMESFDDYLEQNPEKKRQMIAYESIARQMAKGGIVNMREGGILPQTPNIPGVTTQNLDEAANLPNLQQQRPSLFPAIIDRPGGKFTDTRQATPRQLPQADVPSPKKYGKDTKIGDVFTDRAQNPGLPEGGVTIPVGTKLEANQLIDEDTGRVVGRVGVPTRLAGTTEAVVQTPQDANLTEAQMSAPAVGDALDATQAAQTDPNDPRAKILAAQQTASSVGNLTAAQGQAAILQNPTQRKIEQGELISGVANAETASKFTEQIEAATATPSSKATVQGQLANLTADFDATNPPAWAAGALRGVQAQMAARGLGASSIAGQALVQAALESALPIAQADASVQAQFETQNLSNRQQRAMLAAQQRAQFIGQEFDQAFQARVQNAAKISDIANLHYEFK